MVGWFAAEATRVQVALTFFFVMFLTSFTYLILPSCLTVPTAMDSSHTSEATYFSTLMPNSLRTKYPVGRQKMHPGSSYPGPLPPMTANHLHNSEQNPHGHGHPQMNPADGIETAYHTKFSRVWSFVSKMYMYQLVQPTRVGFIETVRSTVNAPASTALA